LSFDHANRPKLLIRIPTRGQCFLPCAQHDVACCQVPFTNSAVEPFNLAEIPEFWQQSIPPVTKGHDIQEMFSDDL
jgi:hypothetical protein